MTCKFIVGSTDVGDTSCRLTLVVFGVADVIKNWTLDVFFNVEATVAFTSDNLNDVVVMGTLTLNVSVNAGVMKELTSDIDVLTDVVVMGTLALNVSVNAGVMEKLTSDVIFDVNETGNSILDILVDVNVTEASTLGVLLKFDVIKTFELVVVIDAKVIGTLISDMLLLIDAMATLISDILFNVEWTGLLISLYENGAFTSKVFTNVNFPKLFTGSLLLRDPSISFVRR